MNWIDTYQIGGQPQPDETDQQILQMIAQALQQGKQPEEIMQILVQGGMPQEEAQQLIQTVMGQMQGQQPMQQSQEQLMIQSGGMSTQDFVNYVLFNSQGGFNGTQKKPANTQGKRQVGGMDQIDPRQISNDGPQGPAQEQEVQQILEMITQALQNGKSPEEIMSALVEAGVPQEQAQQMIQQVMQQSQGGQEEMMQGGGKKKCQTGGDLQSAMGYNYDSPFKNAPYLDIYTPKKVIDMSKTPIDLHLKGNNTNVVLPKFSGKYKVEDQVIRETPYGNFSRKDMSFTTPYEVKPQQTGGNMYLSDILPKKDLMEREDMMRNKMIDYFKTLSSDQLEKRFKEMSGEMINVSSDKYSPIAKSKVPFVQEAYSQVNPVQMVPKTKSTRYQVGEQYEQEEEMPESQESMEMEQSQLDPKVIINKWFEAKRMSRQDMDKFLLSYQQLPEDQKQQLLQTMAQELSPKVMATGGIYEDETMGYYQSGAGVTSSITGDTLTRTSTYMLPDFSPSNVGVTKNPVPKPKPPQAKAAQVISKPIKQDPSANLSKIQTALQQKGYLTGDFKKGVFDGATANALQEFQVKEKIPNSVRKAEKGFIGDLIVGGNTAKALGLEGLTFKPTYDIASEGGRKWIDFANSNKGEYVNWGTSAKGTPSPKGTTSSNAPAPPAPKPASSPKITPLSINDLSKSKTLNPVTDDEYKTLGTDKLTVYKAIHSLKYDPYSPKDPIKKLKENFGEELANRIYKDYSSEILDPEAGKIREDFLKTKKQSEIDYKTSINPFLPKKITPVKPTLVNNTSVAKTTPPVKTTPPKKIESSIEGLANDVSWAASGIYDAGKQLGSNFIKTLSKPSTPSTPLVRKSTPPTKNMQSNLNKKIVTEKDLMNEGENVFFQYSKEATRKEISDNLLRMGYTPDEVAKIFEYRKKSYDKWKSNFDTRPVFIDGKEVIQSTIKEKIKGK